MKTKTAGVSRETAEVVRRKLCEAFGLDPDVTPDGRNMLPFLKDGEDEALPEGSWALCWEGGDPDWTVLFPWGGITEFGATIKTQTLPRSVFTEPQTHWCLAILPGCFQ